MTENSEFGEGTGSFAYVTGGAGGAGGSGGVPVLQGPGGSSATGVLFQSLVCLVARPAESSRSAPPEICRDGQVFSLFLVQFWQAPGTLRLHFKPNPVPKWARSSQRPMGTLW